VGASGCVLCGCVHVAVYTCGCEYVAVCCVAMYMWLCTLLLDMSVSVYSHGHMWLYADFCHMWLKCGLLPHVATLLPHVAVSTYSHMWQKCTQPRPHVCVRIQPQPHVAKVYTATATCVCPHTATATCGCKRTFACVRIQPSHMWPCTLVASHMWPCRHAAVCVTVACVSQCGSHKSGCVHLWCTQVYTATSVHSGCVNSHKPHVYIQTRLAKVTGGCGCVYRSRLQVQGSGCVWLCSHNHNTNETRESQWVLWQRV